MKPALPVLLMVLGILMLGCGSDTEEIEDPLVGTAWTLVSAGGAPAIGSVDLEFYEDGVVGGWGGCNGYQGEYQLSGQSLLAIKGFIRTSRACPTVEENLFEAQHLDLLAAATGFALSDSQLTITTAGGQVILYASERRDPPDAG